MYTYLQYYDMSATLTSYASRLGIEGGDHICCKKMRKENTEYSLFCLVGSLNSSWASFSSCVNLAFNSSISRFCKITVESKDSPIIPHVKKLVSKRAITKQVTGNSQLKVKKRRHKTISPNVWLFSKFWISNASVKKWWQRWDSNPRPRRDWCLKPAP